MTIRNGLGLTAFSTDFSAQLEGNPAEDVLVRTYRNPTLPQISTVTIASFDTNGDEVNVDITLPSGTTVTRTTTRAAGTPADDTAAAAALVTSINALASLNGHVTASSALGVLTLTFLQPGVNYTVATRVTGCTATVATSQAAGGSTVPFGRFVAAGTSVDGQPAIRALTGTDIDAQVRGVLCRPLVGVNLASALSTSVDALAVGELGGVAYTGHVSMKNTGATAASPGGQVFAVIATTGGDELGEARPTVDGVAQVTTLTPAAAQNSVEVSVLVTITVGEHIGKSFTLQALGDASMTATEVCDAWRTQLNADAFWSTILVDSGTATLILTAADASIGFDCTQAMGSTTVTATTAQAVYATPLDRKRFYWAEAVAAGAVGQVFCAA